MTKHGGKRLGAGRKKSPDKAVGRSIYLKPSQWREIDIMRGKLTPSKWVAAKIPVDSKLECG